MSSPLLQIFIDAYTQLYYTKLTLFSSTTLLFYDYLISFDQEIEFVWKKDWSLIKIVFIWHRYFGICNAILQITAYMKSDLNDKFCAFWIRWETWGYCVVIFTTEVVVILWVFVVHNKDLQMLNFMGVLFIAQMVAVVILLAKSADVLNHGFAQTFMGMTMCSAQSEPEFFKGLWTPILIYNAILLVLFLYRGYRVYTVGGRWKNMGLLAKLYKDSLFNFIMIFTSYFVCAAMWLGAPGGLAQIPVGFVLSFSIINSTRLLLSIRHAYYTRIAPSSSTEDIHSSGGMDFPDSETDTGTLVERTPSIYAAETSRELWAFELREIRWAGFD